MRHSIEGLTHTVAKWFGTTSGFVTGISSIAIWIIIGKMDGFSAGWEQALSIYIGIITFLMIFVMQRSQNKELSALHVKLNELIITSTRADNKVMIAQELSEQEISEVQETHRKIAAEEIDHP